MDLGLFGYYPLIDRAKGMYMQIAQAVIVGLNDTNPGCSGAMDLRVLIKPTVDSALGHPNAAGMESGATKRATDAAQIHPKSTGFPELPGSFWTEVSAEIERLERLDSSTDSVAVEGIAVGPAAGPAAGSLDFRGSIARAASDWVEWVRWMVGHAPAVA